MPTRHDRLRYWVWTLKGHKGNMASGFSTSGLSDALVILGAAGIVIPAFARIRISPVIGFILIGILVGPSGLGGMVGRFPWLEHLTISNPGAIAPFAELGIILLLFSIGLELSFRDLQPVRHVALIGGPIQILLTCGLAAAAAVIGLHRGQPVDPG